VAGELAGAGMDERMAGHMPHGAIRWSDKTDKQGFLFIAPLSEAARAEIDRYLAKNPRVGDVPMFPAPLNGQKVIGRSVAARWLLNAEKMAEQPKLQRGGPPVPALVGQREEGPAREGRSPRGRLEGH
jgi:hypothetical protein